MVTGGRILSWLQGQFAQAEIAEAKYIATSF